MISQTHVTTTKAASYLKRLCAHFSHKAVADYDETRGTVRFPFGICEMRAEPDVLVLRVSADDPEAFSRVKEVVGGHLERFGHHDRLQVVWSDED